MRIALSGANGFIGRHVLYELEARSEEVVAIGRSADRFPADSGTHNWVAMNIMHPPGDPFEKMGRPDVLIHLAWGGLPNYQSPHHVKTELPAQAEFLSSCIKHGLKRLVVTGTCYEYGLISGELSESMPTRPCTQYGVAKDALRQKLFALNQQHDFELAWLRLFYLYGEGQSERSLYSMLNAAIERGDKVFDMSGGKQLRDFLPVSEAARLIVDIALHNGSSGLFNICSGNPVSVQQLVQSWIDAVGAKITMNLGRIPYPSAEPMAFWGDRHKLDELLRSP